MGSMETPAEAAGGTVGKALHVLDMVAEKGRPVRFNDVLDGSPYPKATLYRLLQTLTTQGLLSYDEDRQTYAPGMRLVRLAHSAWRQSSLAPVARPFLDTLSSEVGETIHLAQIDRGQVLYVDKRNAAQPVEMFSQAGKIGPGYCTGVGKAMMAFLKPNEREQAVQNQSFYRHTEHTLTTSDALQAELGQIRVDGVAFDREEHEPGIICVAAPILSSNSRVIGALSITTTTQKYSLEGLDALRPVLLQTAQDIAQAAENWQFPSS
ncbi:transcriptional regulator, IclR family [Aliiroseovarius halocynthiae]|uniref:IclR family transcriptional regulator n=1 Tax=Aliiroseovarius halocynthiae TaxID=985055 RepID=A0A545SU83_9RHOB|nr:IclR family transcriptional regulator [Aliiroseovarius halocynthiae]TQV68497.1 IclR family transcriptional regulator [Aliiroseovarius halocynthiae]SMR70895.1 transcriptional regulator, IclR family [Aliiroseovarius halocynthiae]